jgi:hypothetical protein
VTAGVQPRLLSGGFGLPLDPVRLLQENEFERRYIFGEIGLDDEQIAAVEAAIELARRGEYGQAAR